MRLFYLNSVLKARVIIIKSFLLTVLNSPGQGGETNFAFDDVSRSAVKNSVVSVPEPNSVLGRVTMSVFCIGATLRKS